MFPVLLSVVVPFCPPYISTVGVNMPKIVSQKIKQEIIRLKDDEELSFDEIGKKLGLNADTIGKYYREFKENLEKNEKGWQGLIQLTEEQIKTIAVISFLEKIPENRVLDILIKEYYLLHENRIRLKDLPLYRNFIIGCRRRNWTSEQLTDFITTGYNSLDKISSLRGEKQRLEKENWQVRLVINNLYRNIERLIKHETSLGNSVTRLEFRNREIENINKELEQKFQNNQDIIELIKLFKITLINENAISNRELNALVSFLHTVLASRMFGLVNPTYASNEIKGRLTQLITEAIKQRKVEQYA